jgi:hypothetical protein
MVIVLSYGRHVSMYMIFLFSVLCMNYGYGCFLFCVMYELWLWLFSFLCHVFHLETKIGLYCFHLLYDMFHFISMFLLHFVWKNVCFYVMNKKISNIFGHGLLTSSCASNKWASPHTWKKITKKAPKPYPPPPGPPAARNRSSSTRSTAELMSTASPLQFAGWYGRFTGPPA